MDQAIRNQLQRATQDARRLLESEFATQLEGTFDILPDGTILPEPGSHLNDRQQLVRHKIVEAIEHIRLKNVGKTTAQAVDDYLREASFTFLNRFAALKMMEARGLVQQCVTKGDQSSGFKEFIGLAPGLSSLPDKGYQLYLECMFDELGTEINVLFDRRDSASLLWPRRQALLDLLDILNRESLQGIWSEDETIGWVYQYFNSQEERKKMRDESAAPRNSRELAVRNQFFTPRYVVEFLTDNTLGRIWYEMTQGQTALRDRCRYLVRRPDDVFLCEADSDEVKTAQQWLQSGTGERPELWSLANTVNGYIRAGEAGEESNRWVEERLPRLNADSIAEFTTQELLDLLFLFCRKERFCGGTLDSLSAEIDLICKTIDERIAKAQRRDLSQEELLKQPVFIPHRPLKDPRDIKMLDPACGSMHFGLYAFDLFEVIYDEYFAWRLPASIRQEEAITTNSPLSTDFPRLIIECNIHGIDIDPRAVQIAGLSLWLRAQKSWQAQGVKPHARPPIQRSNIVCAEPMPGEANMLDEFAAGLQPKVLGQLVKIIFDKMKLAGEAGSLLKIEEEIADAIQVAHQDYKKFILEQKQEEGYLPGMAPERQATLFDFADLPNAEGFWSRAEELLIAALKAFAEQAQNGGGFQRRLFAEDAARGFAFIDACRKRYDVVVMNPPFGAFPVSADKLLNDMFSACRGDFYPAFIERWNDRSDFLGAITNRTGLSLKGLEGWRQSNLLGARALSLLGDLGMNVLDALVEAAIYVIRPVSREPLIAIDCLDVPGDRMQARVLEGVNAVGTGQAANFVFVRDTASFAKLPTAPISYKAPSSLIRSFVRFDISERNGLKFRVTSPNYDDFRYLRLKWEVSSAEIGRDTRWSLIAKGGEYAPYCDDLDLLIDWDDKAHSFRGFLGTVHRPLTRPACANLFFSGGLTWSERTASRFSPRILPEDAIFSSVGPYCGGLSRHEMMFVLGVIMSAPFQGLLEMFLAAGDATSSGSAARHYQVGALRNLPFPDFMESEKAMIREGVGSLVAQLQQRARHEECNSLFGASSFDYRDSSLVVAINRMVARRKTEIERALLVTRDLDELITRRFGIDTDGMEYLASIFGRHPVEYPRCAELPPSVLENICRPVDEIIRNAVESGRTGRFITVKSYYIDRKIEVLAHYSGISALSILPYYVTLCFQSDARPEIGESLSSYLFGIAFGRWDIRYATGEQAAPELPDPFAPLPVCPTGQLQNTQGLPARPADVPASYPVRIPWDGILVDDPNHPLDIERRVREVIEIIWKDHAEAIEHEACEILGVNSLRSYFRKPAGFFADHLKRYSKSRRQAPIYWPLSTSSGSYTLWIYYHRFRRDTLSLALEDYAKPKLRHEQKQLDDLRADAGPQPTRSQREEIEAQESLVSELSAFVEELARVSPLWNPDLNDGVIINSALLWRMIGHTPWRTSLKECWDTLCAGDFDWARLAMHLWPERCIPKCADDRSLAIAHDLDNLLWVEDYSKWRKLLKPADEILDQKKRRQLPVYDRLREALQQLVAAPQGPTSAETLWERLESGQLDESALALLLWPRRVIGRCINDRALAKTHGVQVPARLTEKSTEQLITRYENAGLPQSVSVVGAVFQRATPWANVWHELEQGECDQQPAALWLWPDRVIEKCLADRELCAQHELTRFFWYDDPVTGWRRRLAPAQEVTAEVTRRHNPTVKAALESLLAAPPLTGAGGGRRGSRTATALRRTRAASPEETSEAAPPARSRSRTSAPTTDVETLDMVKNVIGAAPEGASKTDALTATGLSEARWTAAISTLLQQGSVTKTGERRGTRYHIAEGVGVNDSPTADESETQE